MKLAILLLAACSADPIIEKTGDPVYFSRAEVCADLGEAQCYRDDRCGVAPEDCFDAVMLDCCDDTSQRRPNHRCDHMVEVSAPEIQRCINDAERLGCVCSVGAPACGDICDELDIEHLTICNGG